MTKVIKLSEENYKKLNVMAGELRTKLGRPVPIDDVVSMLLSGNEEGSIRKISQALKGRKEIAACYLFGSTAKGMKGRDIDIGLLLKKGYDYGAFYEGEIVSELERAGIRNVDARILNNAPARFLNQVLKYGKLVFSNDEAVRICFESFAAKRYMDIAPLYSEYDRIRMKRLVA